jgi:hypothetical protein
MAELRVTIADDLSGWESAPRKAALEAALGVLDTAVAAMLAHDQAGAGSAAYPFLSLAAGVVGSWLLGKEAERAEALLAEGSGDAGFLNAKVATASFYIAQRLPLALANIAGVEASADQLALI